MKLIAALFLVIFSAFTCEQVVLPLNCFVGKQGTGMECMKEKCRKGTCMKAMGMGKMKEKPVKKATSAPKCEDCPLCATMITPATIFLSPSIQIGMEYTAIEINPHSEYHTTQWKPPNGGLIS